MSVQQSWFKRGGVSLTVNLRVVQVTYKETRNFFKTVISSFNLVWSRNFAMTVEKSTVNTWYPFACWASILAIHHHESGKLYNCRRPVFQINKQDSEDTFDRENLIFQPACL